MPDRIQLSRRKGWKMPTGTVKIDRSTIWGNPYSIEEWTRDGALELFADLLTRADRSYTRNGKVRQYPDDATILTALRDATAVGCWCALNARCHGDLLLGHLAALEEGYDFEDGPQWA